MPLLPRLALALALGATGLVLSGCAPDDHVLEAVPTQTSERPTSQETSDPVPDPVNTSIGINCQTLLSDEVIYDWGNGNFALDAGFTPEAGSAAARAVSDGGLACRWINLTSSETVDVAVTAPAADALDEAASAAAAEGEPAPLISPTAYFSSAGGVGHVEAFSGAYWLTADSTWFLSPGDAAPLISAALAELG